MKRCQPLAKPRPRAPTPSAIAVARTRQPAINVAIVGFRCPDQIGGVK